jgi:hypothetical protein
VAEQAAAVRALIQQTGWTSQQDIKLLARHFKGVRAPKVQAIAEAWSRWGRRRNMLHIISRKGIILS